MSMFGEHRLTFHEMPKGAEGPRPFEGKGAISTKEEWKKIAETIVTHSPDIADSYAVLQKQFENRAVNKRLLDNTHNKTVGIAMDKLGYTNAEIKAIVPKGMQQTYEFICMVNGWSRQGASAERVSTEQSSAPSQKEQNRNGTPPEPSGVQERRIPRADKQQSTAKESAPRINSQRSVPQAKERNRIAPEVNRAITIVKDLSKIADDPAKLAEEVKARFGKRITPVEQQAFCAFITQVAASVNRLSQEMDQEMKNEGGATEATHNFLNKLISTVAPFNTPAIDAIMRKILGKRTAPTPSKDKQPTRPLKNKEQAREKNLTPSEVEHMWKDAIASMNTQEKAANVALSNDGTSLFVGFGRTIYQVAIDSASRSIKELYTFENGVMKRADEALVQKYCKSGNLNRATLKTLLEEWVKQADKSGSSKKVQNPEKPAEETPEQKDKKILEDLVHWNADFKQGDDFVSAKIPTMPDSKAYCLKVYGAEQPEVKFHIKNGLISEISLGGKSLKQGDPDVPFDDSYLGQEFTQARINTLMSEVPKILDAWAANDRKAAPNAQPVDPPNAPNILPNMADFQTEVGWRVISTAGPGQELGSDATVADGARGMIANINELKTKKGPELSKLADGIDYQIANNPKLTDPTKALLRALKAKL